MKTHRISYITPKQKALMDKLGLVYTNTMTVTQASVAITEELEKHDEERHIMDVEQD